MKITVAVFFGCRSVEHEVSIISAVQAMRAMDASRYNILPIYVAKNGRMYSGNALFDIERYRDMPSLLSECEPAYLLRTADGVVMRNEKTGIFGKVTETAVDVALPVVHGTNCEDGTLSGYLEFLGLPYAGCDILSAAVGMDKAVFKDILKRAGLPVLDCVLCRAKEYSADKQAALEKIVKTVGLPLIIKPVNLGSSVGITKVEDASGLDEAVSLAFSFSEQLLAERAVCSIREINCSVAGDADSCTASVCEEPFMKDAILSYKDKYIAGQKDGESKGMASLGRQVPALLPEEKSEEIRRLACECFKAIGASGVARIDFILDTDTDSVYINEINTIPGSLAFYLWNASGVEYTELLDKMIELAFKRQRTRDNLSFTIDTNILSGASFGTKGAKGAKTP